MGCCDECYFVLGKPHYKGRGSRLRAFDWTLRSFSAPFVLLFPPPPSLAPPSISIPWILLNSNCLAGALFTNAWRWAVARLLLYPLLHLTQSKIHLISFSQVSADRLMYHYAMEQVTTFNVEACHSLFARSWIFYQVSSCFCFCFCFWFFSVKMLPSTRCSETQKRWLTVICLFHVFIVSCQVLFFLVYQQFKMFFFILSFSLTLNSFQCKVKYETAQVLLQGLEEEAHTDEDRRLLNKCILWSRLWRLVCAASTK